MNKTIPKKKKCKKTKWLSEETLQITEKRRDVKGKGERERYTQLKAKFQRIARRDKKAFLSEQCKEIEKNNRMGKTRDLFKKTGKTTTPVSYELNQIPYDYTVDVTNRFKGLLKNYEQNFIILCRRL